MRTRIRHLFAAIAIALIISASPAFACCVFIEQTPEERVFGALNSSDAVFSGKVIDFEFRKGVPGRHDALFGGSSVEFETRVVRIAVDRWWKGGDSKEVIMITDQRRYSDGTGSGSSIDFNFEKGQSYLIFAASVKEYFQTHACTNSKELSRADEDLRLLGMGAGPQN